MREGVVLVMFCKYCGTQLPDGTNFCSKCGRQLSPSVRQPVPRAAQEKPYTVPVTVPTAKVKKTYNLGNFIYWAGCLLSLLSLFLPFASTGTGDSAQSVSMIRAADGIIFLLLILILAVIGLLRFNTGCIVLSVFYMVLAVYERIYTAGRLDDLVTFGLGSILLIAGGAVMILSSAAALILWIRKKRSSVRTIPAARAQGGRV